jgi:hypothetical protein
MHTHHDGTGLVWVASVTLSDRLAPRLCRIAHSESVGNSGEKCARHCNCVEMAARRKSSKGKRAKRPCQVRSPPLRISSSISSHAPSSKLLYVDQSKHVDRLGLHSGG